MSVGDLSRIVLEIFVVLVVILVPSVYLFECDLSGLIDPLTEIFVPIYLLAVFVALIWAVVRPWRG